VERYFEPAGVLSASLFRKDLRNYIVGTVDVVGAGPGNGFGGSYEGYEVESEANGGTGKVEGIELSYSQQFSFLPGIWKGLGAFVNYTYLRTKGDFGTGTVRSGEIPGFFPRTGNLGVSYSYGRWSARALVNYVGTRLRNTSADRPYDYRRYVVDLNTRFRINSYLVLFCDIANATEAHKLLYSEAVPSRELQAQMQAMTVSAGITGRF
jgi:hypothetical protein